MKCPNCGTVNPAGETFCINCGAYLNNAPSSVPASKPVVTNASPAATTFGGSGNTGTSRTLRPNETLQNGRYAIDKILGQGGMGAALLARDTRVSNKLVVIKELISDSTDAEQRKEDVRNFEREVETVASIDHPLVPNVTDYFQEGTRAFMVQEYVAGENLEDHMERINAPMPEREALSYASQVLDILDYLSHQTPPIVHRDIKPANIIIGAKDKRAHLVDFGIARADENKNAKRKQTSALGTPGYAPPEQYQGNADARSDLYALAATIHHLVTNRDPRNYPPFAYPSARSLNPKLSPALDQVLTKALTIDASKRYQTAADMKRDIDNILAHSFNTSGDTSSYVLGTSGPIATTPTVAPRPQPARPAPYPVAKPAAQARQAQQQPRPIVVPPQQQAGAYTNQPAPQRRSNNLIRNLGLLLLVLALIVVAFSVLPNFLNKSSTGTGGNGGNSSTSTTPPGFTIPPNGIGVQDYNGDAIGISDGSYAFDKSDANSAGYKAQAAQKFSTDSQASATLYRQTISTNSKDAEAAIYLENQRALSTKKYVTFVIATTLGSDSNLRVGQDNLQGAYVAQKEYNDDAKLNGGYKVRLLVASSGTQKEYANLVARQIVQLAKSDKTFLGVMGWPLSSRTIEARQTLTDANIPMVSQSASDDSLTGISPYFFRVSPSNKSQGVAGAQYAETTLKATKIVLFFDPADPYSQSLASDFRQKFEGDGNKILATEPYTVNSPSSITDKINDALSKNPDAIYFSGLAADVRTLVSNIPAEKPLPVLGGDALYQLGGYDQGSKAGFTRLRFTAFFYPDVWGILGLNNSPQKPKFFTEYATAFSAGGSKSGYGYDRSNSDVALSYDAVVALLTAYTIAAPAGGQIRTDQLQQALLKTSFQGVSGQVQFGSDGDPVDKSIVVLRVDDQGRITLDKQIGKFLK